MAFDALREELAPFGHLRAGVNRENTMLVRAGSDGAALRGISVTLARKLSDALGVELEVIAFPTAGAVFKALKSNKIDVGFIARDDLRARSVAFTRPYLSIEGNFIVPENSDCRVPADIDQPGHRIAVAEKSAYDLYLTRTLKAGTILRFATAEEAFRRFIDEKLEAVACIRPEGLAFLNRFASFRLIEPCFMKIPQSIGVRKALSKLSAELLEKFIEEMIDSELISHIMTAELSD